MKWLHDPVRIGILSELIPDLGLASFPIASELARSIPIRECGEALVELRGTDVRLHPVYSAFGFEGDFERPIRVRVSVRERLLEAQGLLPPPFSLVVIDGWRSVQFQSELVRYYGTIYNSTAGFVADPDDSDLVAPHLTGGAVDLTLAYEGLPLGLGSDFDEFSDRAHSMWYEKAGGVAANEPGGEYMLYRRLRRLLSFVMFRSGFRVLDLEWWHWSFGDQRWAAASAGVSEAIYGPMYGLGDG